MAATKFTVAVTAAILAIPLAIAPIAVATAVCEPAAKPMHVTAATATAPHQPITMQSPADGNDPWD